MDWFITFCKENFDLISLFVGFVGVIIGVISVIQAKRDKKAKIELEIEQKQARLDAMNEPDFMFAKDHTVVGKLMAEKEMLEAEIKRLKKKL